MEEQGKFELKLASGEEVLASCDYRTVTSRDYNLIENFTLTNKRLINNSMVDEKTKQQNCFTYDKYEIPVEVKSPYDDILSAPLALT